MVKTSVEDIKNLVAEERKSEEELQKAREEAARILQEAKAEAKRISEQAEDGRYYEAIYDSELKKTDEKKKTLETEFSDLLERLEKTARTNMKSAVAFIVEKVLGK